MTHELRHGYSRNRLDEFNHGQPPPGKALQVLCEDHNGTYLLPFKCEYRSGAWYNAEKKSAQAVEAKSPGDLGEGSPYGAVSFALGGHRFGENVAPVFVDGGRIHFFSCAGDDPAT
jgi:hypothetical protein